LDVQLTQNFQFRRNFSGRSGFFSKTIDQPCRQKIFAAKKDPDFFFSIRKKYRPAWKNPAPGFPTSLRFIPRPEPSLISACGRNEP